MYRLMLKCGVLVFLIPAHEFQSVSGNPVVIYSKSTCVHCTEARKLFDAEKIPYFSLDIDKTDNGRALFESVHSVTRSRYVPQIFICGKYIGGYDILEAMRNQGLLRPLVDQCLNDRSSSNVRVRNEM